ncbi:hypothetical protein [Nostoc sp. FACHB-857]|nr:hypothetical protein [Nostoc sp. FACHB-857]
MGDEGDAGTRGRPEKLITNDSLMVESPGFIRGINLKSKIV